MMFKHISSLVFTTNSKNNWLNNVGKKVISVGNWMAWRALSILHVSLSAGTAAGFGSNSLSAWTKRLNKCWSRVFIVETRLKLTVKMGFCPSIQLISGPAFYKKKSMIISQLTGLLNFVTLSTWINLLKWLFSDTFHAHLCYSGQLSLFKWRSTVWCLVHWSNTSFFL